MTAAWFEGGLLFCSAPCHTEFSLAGRLHPLENPTDRRMFNTSDCSNSLFGHDGTWHAGVNALRMAGVEACWRR
ncbi:hypothetical protein ACYX7E_18130 [Luteimonas sp. RIT-PG2_3]